MKTVVIYKSAYGSAKKYAEYIAKSLDCEVLNLKEASVEKLADYDAVIFGGGMYVGKISGAEFISKNFDKLKGKKLAVFAVGLSAVDDIAQFKSAVDAGFTPEIQERIKFFYLRGGMDIRKLSFVHRMMMSFMGKTLKKKPPEKRSSADSEIIAIVAGHAEDFFSAESADALVEYIKA